LNDYFFLTSESILVFTFSNVHHTLVAVIEFSVKKKKEDANNFM